MKYSIFCPTKREDFYRELENSLFPITVTKIQSEFGQSFSQLINLIIDKCQTEYVIISNDKARPTQDDLYKLIKKLDYGYDFVGLYRMGFFGFRKSLINTIGYFDENFQDGGYEDNDFYIRLKANNCAMYISEEIDYKIGIDSLWPQKLSKLYFFSKYKFDHKRKLIITKARIKNEDKSSAKDINKKALRPDFSNLSQIPLQTYSARFDLVIQNYKIVIVKQFFPIWLINSLYSYRLLRKNVIPIDQRKYYNAQSL